MQSFLDKIKGIFNKDNFGKIGVFFVENKRYFAAALLFVLLVLVLKFGINPKNAKDNQIADTQKPQEENNGDFSLSISGMALAAVIGIILNIILKEEEEI